MARFNWAYIDCSSSSGTSNAAGPTGSVQFISTGTNTTGSTNFLFYSASVGGYDANTLALTGTVRIDGALYANEYHVSNVTEASGSTYFGNSNDDVHIRTGSMTVALSSSTPILDVSTTTERVTVRGFAGRYTPVTASLFTSSNSTYLIGVQQAGNVEMRIHEASTAQSGAILMIKDEVTSRIGQIVISSSAGSTIDGGNFYVLSGSYPAISLYSNGANWFVY
jgi:hypothetical protein